ncbi:hypothetical protein [Streptomyces sp. NPDC056160]|uniref:hypothetical protein n=1 Tax=Streptomyces sp. NPDC056160 TaxID=3345731 RepID=UPI0035DDAE10
MTDLEYEQMAARFSDDGVYGSPADPAIASAGTGLAVAIRPGAQASVRGHTWDSGSTVTTLPVDANASRTTRVDWVVLRLDRADWTVKAAIRPGTPGAGAPALVQDTGTTGVYEIPLALVTVPSGSGTVTVTRAELYVGTRVRPCTSTTRNPLATPGELGFEVDTGRLILRTVTGWATIYESSDVISIDSSVGLSWGWRVGSVLELRSGIVTLRLGTFEYVAPSLAANVESRLPVLIPEAYRPPSRTHYVLGYVRSDSIARLTIYPRSDTTGRAGQVWLTNHGAISRNDFLLPETGQSWVVG